MHVIVLTGFVSGADSGTVYRMQAGVPGGVWSAGNVCHFGRELLSTAAAADHSLGAGVRSEPTAVSTEEATT